MRRATVLVIFLAVSMVALAPAARADSMNFTCSDSTKCNGNLYAVGLVSHTGNTYVLEFGIEVTAGYTGGATDVVRAVALKNFASSYTNYSLVLAPDGISNWGLSQKELSANGCSGGVSGGLCAEASAISSYRGASLPSIRPGVLAWRFQFDSPGPLNPTVYIKYEYMATAGKKDGKKVGDLGSWNIPIQTQIIPDGGVTLMLLGGALVGLESLRRKFRA